MRTKLFIYTLLAALGVISSACQEEIDLASHEFKKHVYVDGGITNEKPPYTVEIYVTSPLDDPRRIPYSNCNVTIHENTGRIESLTETEPGVYMSSSGGMKGKIGNAYRIDIEAPDGKKYRSDFTTMKTPVGIDTVYGKVTSKEQLNSIREIEGYQFYISTRQGGPETYLMWKMDETYEYTADFLYAGMMYRGQMYEQNAKDSLYRCWRNRKIPEVFTANTVNLQTPKISNKPLHFVSNQSKRLQELYSLLVRQYTIDRAAFNYWDDIGEQIEGGDFLNVRQPFQIQGNVYNPEDEKEAVLGYFNVASVEKRRIFINPAMEIDLIKCHIKYNVLFLYQISFRHPVYFGYGSTGRGVVNELCIDCRLEGGKLEKPDFWPGR